MRCAGSTSELEVRFTKELHCSGHMIQLARRHSTVNDSKTCVYPKFLVSVATILHLYTVAHAHLSSQDKHIKVPILGFVNT